MLKNPDITAPLSVPLVISTYLVDALNEDDAGGIKVVWPRDYPRTATGESDPDALEKWFFGIAGVSLNTHEQTTVGVSPPDDDSSTVDPDIAKFTHQRTLVAAQASGFSFPKWGLDYVRARVFSLVNSKVVPAIEAEDMMERIKLALNSLDGRNIWRMTRFPIKVPTAAEPLTFDQDSDMIPFNMLRGIRHFKDEKGVVHVLPDLYKVVRSADDQGEEISPPMATAPYNIPFEHVANWASTVLDGNTIQQVASGSPVGQESYTAFSIDFTMYIELVHEAVLGFREPFVDRRVV